MLFRLAVTFHTTAQPPQNGTWKPVRIQDTDWHNPVTKQQERIAIWADMISI